jgi:hypothetical protein
MCASTESAIEARIKSLSGHNIAPSPGAARKMQHGVFYRKVLRAACDDGKLGEKDKYAVEFCRTVEANRVEPLSSVSSSQIWTARCLPSSRSRVPWRASISARPAQSCSQRITPSDLRTFRSATPLGAIRPGRAQHIRLARDRHLIVVEHRGTCKTASAAGIFKISDDFRMPATRRRSVSDMLILLGTTSGKLGIADDVATG